MKNPMAKTAGEKRSSALAIASCTLLCAALPSVALPARSQEASHTGSSSSTSTLLIDSNQACNLNIDELDSGTVMPEASRRISVTKGQHLIKAVPQGKTEPVWRKVVEVSGEGQVVVLIGMKAMLPEKPPAKAVSPQKPEPPPGIPALGAYIGSLHLGPTYTYWTYGGA